MKTIVSLHKLNESILVSEILNLKRSVFSNRIEFQVREYCA